ncbi:polyketide synthase [Aspergillus arachidicola]|uniref:Polyketide synthase n=1 Tax=Aspergillus arachidicola TaxID=656916 RepID=A0A2G7FLA4_9EURO|nr:polyketide synthase [Aspergillus arachidicola]
MAKAEPIAIVGRSCRFPGGSSTTARLWELLLEPRDLSSGPPSGRFNADAFYHDDPRRLGTTNAVKSYFLDEPIDRFDAPFFNISRTEAESIDPQQRLLLETVYEGLEAAGCRLEDLSGSSTGVFCGVMCDDYRSMVFRDLDTLPRYAATGTSQAIIANRISYFFNLRGPSITVDTACSSSLVAVHLAARALADGDCSVAVAAGTNLILAPNVFLSESSLNMLSPTGHSRMWDANADGYARGEGVAAVVMKRLSDAIRDGDHIECVVRATNVNQDGRTPGITMPCPEAQKELIMKTYADAGLDPQNRPEDRCQYFEAHGTGTRAGDPQEARAIHDAFFGSSATASNHSSPLLVGSVKTIIGHTEGAAGLAGLLKASLCIENATISPNMHFENLNRDIAPYAGSLRVPTEVLPWPTLSPGTPRRASVNSFGFGGTNAHIILESYDAALGSHSSKGPPAILPFVFSASSEWALGQLLHRYCVFLDENPDIDLTNFAWSLFARRSLLSHRLWFCASSGSELRDAIKEEIYSRQSGTPATILGAPRCGPKRILGIFTGQGAQWATMGMELITACPAAGGWMAEMQKSLDELPDQYRNTGFSLMHELSLSPDTSRINQATVSQPLCTAVQIVLIRILSALGIELSAVIGHSSGEIAAAYAAGFITASDAIRIAYFRGVFSRLARSNSGQAGSMAAAGLSHEEAETLCRESKWAGRVTIAAYNSPSSVTLSGDADGIHELCSVMQNEGKFCRALKVDTAYHSNHMLACSAKYKRALEDCRITPTRNSAATKWFSSVLDGRIMSQDDQKLLYSEYWNENLVSPVRFNQAVLAVTRDMSFDLAIEIGPHPALKGPFQQSLSSAEIPYTSMLKRGSNDMLSVASMIGNCWAHLGPDSIHLAEYIKLCGTACEPQLLKPLPSYPFDHRERYWGVSRLTDAALNRKDAPDELLGSLCPDSGEGEWRWRNHLRHEDIPWIDGHRVQSQIIFPISAYLAMLWKGVRVITTAQPFRFMEISDVELLHTVVLDGHMEHSIETLFKVDVLTDDKKIVYLDFTCYIEIEGSMRRCVSGKASLHKGEESSTLLPTQPFDDCSLTLTDSAPFYSTLAKLGYEVPEEFKVISKLQHNVPHTRGILRNLEQTCPNTQVYYGVALDASIQALLAAADAQGPRPLSGPFVPSKIRRIVLNPMSHHSSNLENRVVFDSILSNATSYKIQGDVDLFADGGQGIMQLEGVSLVPSMHSDAGSGTLFSEVAWGRLNPHASAEYADRPIGFKDQDAETHERISLCYLAYAAKLVPQHERIHMSAQSMALLHWIDNVLDQTSSGGHPVCRMEWMFDTIEQVEALAPAGSNCRTYDILHAAGRELVNVIRRQSEAEGSSSILDEWQRHSIDIRELRYRMRDVLEQICFRYPHLNILEVGGGEANDALAGMGLQFKSYIRTKPPHCSAKQQSDLDTQHGNEMMHLDISKCPVDQGYTEHSYDMILIPSVLYTNISGDHALLNLRRLLKPGGYLLAIQETNPSVVHTVVLAASLGIDRKETWTPNRWHAALQDSGFSGIDTMTPNVGTSLQPYSLIVSQAVDDTVRALRDPLMVPNTAVDDRDLYIIGGNTPETADLLQGLEAILTPRFRSLFKVPELKALRAVGQTRINVLYLGSLDTADCEDIDRDRYNALQDMVNMSDNILWMKRGTRSRLWNQGNVTAVLRSLSSQKQQLCLQCLEMSHGTQPTACSLATALLRLTNSSLGNDHQLPTHVWSNEPHLLLEDGVVYIPRIRYSESMNQRATAYQQTTYQDVQLSKSGVRLVSTSGHHHLAMQPVVLEEPEKIRIQVTLSSQSAIKICNAYLYLVVGKVLNGQSSVICLSDECASVVSVPSCWVWPFERVAEDGPKALMAVILALTAVAAVNLAGSNTTLVVHEPCNSLRELLVAYAHMQNVSLLFTTGSSEFAPSDRFIHPLSPNRVLAKLLPDNVSMILRCDEETGGIFSRSDLPLGPGVTVAGIETLFSSEACICGHEANSFTVADFLPVALGLAEGGHFAKDPECSVVDVQQLADLKHDTGLPAVVDWSKRSFVRTIVQKASSELLFSAELAYLFIDLDGATAMQVAELLIHKGARKIVLIEPSSAVGRDWIHEMAQLGAQVDFMSMNTTDQESVVAVKNTIIQDIGQIGGVMSGVIRTPDPDVTPDTAFVTVQSTPIPKIHGARILSDVFNGSEMDFFILSAPNMWPAGFPSQHATSLNGAFLFDTAYERRRKGLVASIIHSNSLAKMGLSKEDIGEVFAEAIIGGRMSSQGALNVIPAAAIDQGMRNSDIAFSQNPILWSMIGPEATPSIRVEGQFRGQDLTLKEELIRSSREIDNLQKIIQRRFTAKLQKTLRLRKEDPILANTALFELGVDSLVATSLRSWFVNEVGIDMPIMNLLNNASIGSLVQYAAKEWLTQAANRDERDSPVSWAQGPSESSGSASPTTRSSGAASSLGDMPLCKGEYARVEHLSYAQSRYWFLQQYYEDRTAFNVTLLFTMDGQPSETDLQAAIQIVSQRHQSLRTCYLSEGTEMKSACQAVLPISPVTLEVCDIEDESGLFDEYARMRDHPYDTEKGECIRFRLVKTPAAASTFLIIGYPHMCMDGASCFILLDELDQAYRKLSLPPVSRQYPDFAAAQRLSYEQGMLHRELDYWKKELSPLPEPVGLLPMTKVRSRPPLKEYDTHELQFCISNTIMNRIRSQCRRHRVTPFHFSLAVLRILLARLTKIQDCCIGVADSNRLDPSNESTVGFLLNLLPLRFRTLPDNFTDVLVGTRDACYGALTHSAMPFDKLLDELAVPRSNTHSPLFQVLMDWQPRLGGEVKLGDITSSCTKMTVGRTIYDLTLLVTESARGDATIHFRTQKALYSKEGSEVLARSYINLLEAFTDDLDLQVNAPCIWHPSDLERAVEVGQGPTYKSQWPSTVSRRIEEVSGSQPSNTIAVTDTKGRSFTYRGMMDRVRTLAFALRDVGVGPGSFVCIFQHPTAEWVCCMLAIWRLNAVYVPLDLRNPPSRLMTVIQDCQPTAIFCNDETDSDVRDLGCPGVALLNTSEICAYGSLQSTVHDLSSPDAPAAVLYTSGSTGKPKGILLRHSSIRNQVEGYTRRWELGPEIVLQQGAMTFNHSLDQILTGLCTAGRVVVATRDIRGDPVSLTKLIGDEQITYTKATPAEYSMWLRYGSASLRTATSWRHAFGGGEHLTTTLSQGFQALELPNLSLYNSYGPGEITISSHKMKIDYKEPSATPDDIFPVGFSLPNYTTYVVDEAMQLVPPGVSGEILIGGAGPCLGYLHREALTAEKFIENHFASSEYTQSGWTRAYRTFDRGRLLSDGSLVIEGRLDGDTQVKIRGIRIELEDIENSIIQASDGKVLNAVVSIHGEDSQLLTAHVVLAPSTQGGAPSDLDSFLQQLRATLPLPQYMCPSVFIPVHDFPLTIHGKVDRKAIRAMPLPQAPTSNRPVEELSGTEAMLREIWAQVLESTSLDATGVGREDDFFMVGGNSVLLVKLQALIRQTLRVSVPLVELFSASTLGDMAGVVQNAIPTIELNWMEETSLPDLAINHEPPRPVTNQGIVIVLTGATGFLGHVVLQQLLAEPTVSHIYAVGVRTEGRGIGRPLPSASPKFTALNGDLGQPMFGLDESTFATLAASTHVIIHSGANRSFWDAYPIIRGANVLGTKNVVALASHQKIPIHFLSSGAVEKVVESNAAPPTDGRNGYLASKWASEKILTTAAEKMNTQVTIHRLTQAPNVQPPPQDIIAAFSAIAEQMNCIPTAQGWGRLISLLPLGELATSIVSHALISVGQQVSAKVTIENHMISTTFELSDAAEAVDRTVVGADRMDSLHMLYWLGRAKRESKFPWFVAAQDVIVNSEGQTVRVELD